MKTPVSVTLILMGTLLLLASAVIDFLFQHNVVTLLTHVPTANPTLVLTTRLSTWSQVAYWVVGSFMILFGILGAMIYLRGGSYTQVPDEFEQEEEDEEDQT